MTFFDSMRQTILVFKSHLLPIMIEILTVLASAADDGMHDSRALMTPSDEDDEPPTPALI